MESLLLDLISTLTSLTTGPLNSAVDSVMIFENNHNFEEQLNIRHNNNHCVRSFCLANNCRSRPFCGSKTGLQFGLLKLRVREFGVWLVGVGVGCREPSLLHH